MYQNRIFARTSVCFFLLFLVTAVSGRPEPEICPLQRRFWVNTLAQEVLRQFTQWPWIDHPTFQLRSGYFTTELVPHKVVCTLEVRDPHKQRRAVLSAFDVFEIPFVSKKVVSFLV